MLKEKRGFAGDVSTEWRVRIPPPAPILSKKPVQFG
jgi:hypothetical protein